MNRTVTVEETQKLYEFCQNHFVYHYDLQVELVDHLASSIEEQWEENPDVSFEEALGNTFKKFGVTGFSKIKEQKQKELTRNYNRLLWRYLLEFLSWPKILMTIAFTAILVTAFNMVKNELWIIVPYFGILTLFASYYYCKISPRRFKDSKINGKKFLLLEQLKRVQVSAVLFVQIPIQIVNFNKILDFTVLQNDLGIMMISLLIIFLTITMVGELFYVPQKIKVHFKEQFPEFAPE